MCAGEKIKQRLLDKCTCLCVRKRGRDNMSLVFLKAFLNERIVYSFVLLGRATAPSAIIQSFALTIHFITEMKSFLVNSSLQFIIDCYVSIILSIYLSINLSTYQSTSFFYLFHTHTHSLSLYLFPLSFLHTNTYTYQAISV